MAITGRATRIHPKIVLPFTLLTTVAIVVTAVVGSRCSRGCSSGGWRASILARSDVITANDVTSSLEERGTPGRDETDTTLAVSEIRAHAMVNVPQ